MAYVQETPLLCTSFWGFCQVWTAWPGQVPRLMASQAPPEEEASCRKLQFSVTCRKGRLAAHLAKRDALISLRSRLIRMPGCGMRFEDQKIFDFWPKISQNRRFWLICVKIEDFGAEASRLCARLQKKF